MEARGVARHTNDFVACAGWAAAPLPLAPHERPEQTGAMALIRLDVVDRTPYEGSRNRPYERIDAVAHYTADPDAEGDAEIVDLDLAPRGDDGLVHYEGDVTLLRPLDGGRRTAIVEVPNRGRRTLFGLYNRAAPVLAPTAEIDPGDGYLLDQGYTIAWCGWQWDVPRSPARMGLAAPLAPIEAELQLRLQLHGPTATVALTDQHTGQLGNHEPIPTADVADPEARLLVRDRLWDEPVELPRSSWRFIDETNVSLDGGFESGRIYDLVYRTSQAPVTGAGLLALRDLAGHLRSTEDLDHVLATGQSQCGRFLRTFLYHGLNRLDTGPDSQDDQASPAYDGLLIHIAGARRGEFNHRMAQPSVQPTPSFGHLFPFADEIQTDPTSGSSDGLLERQHLRGALPKVIYTNTASEYWRGDASLAHTTIDGTADVEPPATTRHYLLSSTQHGPGVLPMTDEAIFGSKGGNSFNIVDFTPLMRASMANLAAWVEESVEPPRSNVPRIADGTAVPRSTVLAELAARDHLPPITTPEAEGLSTLRPLDLGPGAADGVGRYPAVPVGEPYPCFVSAVDEAGNEVAGIAMPDVTVPLATHTGWNPRRADTRASDQILEYVGSTVPFTPAQVAERHGDEAAYLTKIEHAAQQLVAQGFLLPEDVEVCVAIAAKRFRALVAGP